MLQLVCEILLAVAFVFTLYLIQRKMTSSTKNTRSDSEDDTFWEDGDDIDEDKHKKRRK